MSRVQSVGRMAPGVWLLLGLAGCSSVGGTVGVSVPVVPGVHIGVGVGTGGMHLGVGASAGSVGAGVAVNQRGQVTGNAGVGGSVPVGNSGVRVGGAVGTGTVLHDPDAPPSR